MMTILRRATCLVLLAAAFPATAQQTIMVPAPDGTPLATDVYLPPGAGPWPVLLSRTPYDKDAQFEIGIFAALTGLAYVAQDTRGRFASGGDDTVFRDDGADGRATLDWILAQPWCDGRVATWGPSALGITQYLMAPDADPRLVCQLPIVATADMYADAAFPGGAFREALLVNWLSGQGSLDALDEFLSHRLRDDWWDPLDALSRAGRVRSAGLHLGGWYDIFQQGTLDAFRTVQQSGGDGARGRQYLVMGPWTHNDYGLATAGQLSYPPNSILDLDDLLFDWLDHCFDDGPDPVDDWPAVRVYLMGAVGEPGAPGNRWVDLGRWPPAARAQALYLSPGGRLDSQLPQISSLGQLTMDPADPVPTLGGANLFPDLIVDGRAMGDGPWDQGSIESRSDVLHFTTDPLDSPVTVMGRVRVRLWIEPDTPDLDLAVRLTDVYPDGRSMLVVDGIARARARCGDDRECLLTEGEPVELEIDLTSTAMVFNAGHRIRIVVSGSNWPRFEVNPNHGAPFESDLAPRVARPMLLVGPDHPSRVELPVPVTPRRASGRRAASEALRPPLGLTVNACGDVEPGDEGGVIADLAARGMDFYTFRGEWSTLESDPSLVALLQWAIPWADGLGMHTMLTIPTLDTVVRTMPDELLDLPMDHPDVLARFDALLDRLVTPEMAAALDWVSVGNEVDAYLASRPDEVPAFRSFVAHAQASLAARGIAAPVCATLTHRGWIDDPNGIATDLRAICDVLPVTWYPMGADQPFEFLRPEIAVTGLDEIVAAAAGLPIVLQEIGYASSEANGGSEQRQAEFLDRTLERIVAEWRVRAVNVEWSCDVPRDELEVLAAELYGVTPADPIWEPFLGFLGSLGLRHEDGRDKPAHGVFLEHLATGPRAP